MKPMPTPPVPRPSTSAAITRVLLSLVSALVLTGCVTRGYKLADKTVPPPTAINLTSAGSAAAAAAPPRAEVTLQSVISYQGPGSWKKEAYWDEYVVAITNRGEAPLTISQATLLNASGEALSCGDDPWKLERAGKTWWQSSAGEQTRTLLKLGAGTVAGASVAVAGALSGGFLGPVTGAGATAMGVGTAAVVALPLVAVGTVAMNIHGKHQVETEFSRRRLALPASVAPGQTVPGSLFFRISPGPQRLVMRGQAGDEPLEITVDLAPLQNLHLKAPETPASPPPTTPPAAEPAPLGGDQTNVLLQCVAVQPV